MASWNEVTQMAHLQELYTESSISNCIHLNIVKVYNKAGVIKYQGLCEVTKANTFIVHTKYTQVELELVDIKKIVDTGKSTYIMLK